MRSPSRPTNSGERADQRARPDPAAVRLPAFGKRTARPRVLPALREKLHIDSTGQIVANILLIVSGSFLHELHPRANPELVVDVGEVALYGARRDEKPCSDVVVGQPFAD
jgi:hypothetical protein